MPFWSLLLLAACTPRPATEPELSTLGWPLLAPGPWLQDTDGGSTDTAAPGDTAPPALNGTAPDEPLPLPAFSALNQFSQERGPSHLLGHATVLWWFTMNEEDC